MHDGYLSNVAIIKSPSNMLASCECVHAESHTPINTVWCRQKNAAIARVLTKVTFLSIHIFSIRYSLLYGLLLLFILCRLLLHLVV